jgi:asparagine synthase (glutamine-hydrolysing)
MCGLLGVIGGYSADEVGRFESSLGLLVHRGPDNVATQAEDRVWLGHTRLSIVDLSESAHQPMRDSSGRFTLVFNGEIYNYKELRTDLESHGVRFRTDADTEVVLEAYKRFGPECLHMFNGMWGLAIHDSTRNEVFLARDRFGVKPLYYADLGDRVCFSSEMKSLLALGVSADANWDQLSSFLLREGCDTGRTTVFENVSSVLPGEWLKIAESGQILERSIWWAIHEQRVDVPRTYKGRVEALRALIEDAVRIRLRTDVPTGVALSGGVDSSTIYGAARHLERGGLVESATNEDRKDFNLFTISNAGTAVDEYFWVDECLKYWNDENLVRKAVPDPSEFPERIDQVIWHQEAPVWSAAVFAFHNLYRTVAESGTRVILEGHGADEMFAGYPHMVQAAVNGFSDRLNPLPLWRASHSLAATSNSDLDQDAGNPLALFARSWRPSRPLMKPLLAGVRALRGSRRSASAVTEHSGYFTPEILNRPKASHSDAGTPLEREMYAAFTGTILPITLRVFDRASMAHGVESRAPFLDYRIVQFAFSLQDEDKVGRFAKNILRDAAEPWIPKSVRTRKAKLGFTIPDTQWFGTPVVYEYLLDVFGSSEARSSSMFDNQLVIRDIEQGIKGGFDWATTTRVWEVLNIHLWQQKFAGIRQ